MRTSGRGWFALAALLVTGGCAQAVRPAGITDGGGLDVNDASVEAVCRLVDGDCVSTPPGRRCNHLMGRVYDLERRCFDHAASQLTHACRVAGLWGGPAWECCFIDSLPDAGRRAILGVASWCEGPPPEGLTRCDDATWREVIDRTDAAVDHQCVP